jgi:DNA-binding GntR family transcriptional regulator
MHQMGLVKANRFNQTPAAMPPPSTTASPFAEALGPSPQPSLVERLTAEIESEILEGRLKPGERLDEAALTRRFAVSRTPIREALRLLASSRLVELRPRLGATVARPTAGEVVELFELVAELEGIAARLAAERMDAAALAAIGAAHQACQQAAGGDDAAAYYQINGQFHGAIHRAARNLALVEEIAMLDKRLSPYRRFITFRPGRTQAALREHDEILRAIQGRDGERAALAMRDHVRILGEDALILAKGLRV